MLQEWLFCVTGTPLPQLWHIREGGFAFSQLPHLLLPFVEHGTIQSCNRAPPAATNLLILLPFLLWELSVVALREEKCYLHLGCPPPSPPLSGAETCRHHRCPGGSRETPCSSQHINASSLVLQISLSPRFSTTQIHTHGADKLKGLIMGQRHIGHLKEA